MQMLNPLFLMDFTCLSTSNLLNITILHTASCPMQVFMISTKIKDWYEILASTFKSSRYTFSHFNIIIFHSTIILILFPIPSYYICNIHSLPGASPMDPLCRPCQASKLEVNLHTGQTVDTNRLWGVWVKSNYSATVCSPVRIWVESKSESKWTKKKTPPSQILLTFWVDSEQIPPQKK